MTAALLSWLHILGVATGLGAVVARGYFLRASPWNDVDRDRALNVDGIWGLSALLLWCSGPLRAFAGFEKGTAFYTASPMFWTKMSILLVVAALEMWPMITLIRWRVALRRGHPIDTSRARLFGAISYVQAAGLVAIIACATLMARGFLYTS